MDRNSIIGLVLIFVILITFAYINQPDEAEIQAAKRKQDSITLVQKEEARLNAIAAAEQAAADSVKHEDTLAAQVAFGTFSSFASGTETFSSIENEELKVTFSNKGGRIYKVEMKKHKRADGSPLVLMDGPKNAFSYSFATKDAKAISTGDLFFTAAPGTDGKSMSMTVKLGDRQYIEQVYSLSDNPHLVSYKLNLVGMESVIAPNFNYLDLTWKSHMLQQEKDYEAEFKTTTACYRYADDEPTTMGETKEEKEELKTPVQWIAYKQQYFNTSLIAEKPLFDNGSVETKNDESKSSLKILQSELSLPYTHGANESYQMKFLFSPNHYKTLAALDLDLERIIPMGWGIFRWVNKYVVVNVFDFLSRFIGSYGLIILLLTLIVKTILFPLVYRSYLSAAKMRILKPEIDEIKAKYGDDMQRVQQENMKIYRKAGVNPLGGCVPMLLQLPILLAMFQFFPSAFELRQQSFLWANDLSTYDSIWNMPFEIPFYGSHVSLFTLLMTASTLIYTLYNNQMTGVTGQMKWMSYIMPIIFLGVLNSYPAGLNYYYFLSNVVTIAQQLMIRRFVDDKALHAQIQENKKKPVTKSKFQARLEEMAKKRGIDLDPKTPAKPAGKGGKK